MSEGKLSKSIFKRLQGEPELSTNDVVVCYLEMILQTLERLEKKLDENL